MGARLRLVASVAAGIVVLGCASPTLPRGRAQDASPTVEPGPRISGAVSGGVRRGNTLSFRADVTMPGGWQALHLVEVSVLVDDRELERMTYEVESSRVAIGGREVLAGTGATSGGSYLRVRGLDVIVTTGGPYLSVIIRAQVTRDVPEAARFVLSASSDAGTSARVTRGLTEQRSGGVGWGTLVTIAVLTLVVGAFLGNLVASRRRSAPRLSVYGAIRRQLDAERSAGPKR